MVLEKRRPLLAYVLSTFYLLVVAVTYTSLNPNLVKIGVWSSVFGFGAWLFYLYKTDTPLRYPRLLIPIAGYMLLRFLTTTQAPFPIISFEVALRELILLFGFLFVFSSLDLFWKPRTWEDTLINFALVFSFVELGLAYFWHSIWVDITGSLFPLPPVGYRSPGVFLGHPNILAGFLNLVAPIMVVRLVREQRWGKRALWGTGLLIFVPTLYFTSSRTGLMAGIMGVFVTLFLLYVPELYQKLREVERRSLWEIIPRRVIFFALAGIFIVAGFVIFFLIQSQKISTHAPTLISARSGIWGPALEVIKEAPILGHGPGSFSVFFAQETQIPPGFATSHAHNILLQVAAETGLVGVGLVLGIIVRGTLAFVRAWRGASSLVRKRLAAYAGAGMAVLSHHSLDYLFESPLYALSVFILLALAMRETPAFEVRSLQYRPAILPLAILVFFLGGSIYTSVGGSDYWNGVNAGRDGDWETAAAEICRAYEKRPQVPLYGFQCSLAHAQLHYRNGDPAALEEALRVQREALESDPYWPVHWANLAALEWESGEFEKAVTHMQNALYRAPRNSTIAINLALMEETQDKQETAISAYVQALMADPWLQFNTIFEGSPVARQALDRFLHEENDDIPGFLAIQGWTALTSGELDLARDSFLEAIEGGTQEGHTYAGLALALQQLGQMHEAKINIEIAIFFDPTSPLVLHAAGVVAKQQGQDLDALQLLLSAFNQIEDFSYSPSYYDRTYRRIFLPSDIMPETRRGMMTPAMVEDFQVLVEFYKQQNEPAYTSKIQKRIQIAVTNSMP